MIYDNFCSLFFLNLEIFPKKLMKIYLISLLDTMPKFRTSTVHSIHNFTLWCVDLTQLLLVDGSTECSSVYSPTMMEF